MISTEDHRRIIRDSAAVGLATGTYGLSFGALAAAAGLSLAQSSALSLLMFSGASQFALVGVIAAGGLPMAGAASAALLGLRNGLYGLHLARVLSVRGGRRVVAAQLVIDESAAMAVGRGEDAEAARLAFWLTGAAVFGCWNAATVVGALGAGLLTDPGVLGLDAVAPAAFAALLRPRLISRPAWLVALGAAGATLLVAGL